MTSFFGLYLFWASVVSLTSLSMGYHIIGWSFVVGFDTLLGLFVPPALWLSR